MNATSMIRLPCGGTAVSLLVPTVERLVAPLKVLLSALLLTACAHAESPYKVGVYYFPGWRSGMKAAPSMEPWEAIRKTPAREPLLGWYDDGSTETVNTQLGWMHDYGLTYVVFDWYWGGGKVLLDQSLQAYFKAANRSKVPFALLWANHDAAPTSREDFAAMVRYWIENYFKRPETFKVDGRPVVFVFDHGQLQAKASAFGSDVPTLIALSQTMMREAGLPPIFFVGSTFNKPKAVTFGYDATSTYNYQGIQKPSHSYAELTADYATAWQFQTGRHDVPYIVPMTQGWDRTPWGGSKDRQHDQSGGDIDRFDQHLRAARSFMDKNPEGTLRMGVICCWNEFGEGSYIEPTKSTGFSYLEKVKATFGPAGR
jgi:Glycosyltransferase WbsX